MTAAPPGCCRGDFLVLYRVKMRTAEGFSHRSAVAVPWAWAGSHPARGRPRTNIVSYICSNVKSKIHLSPCLPCAPFVKGAAAKR